MVYERMMDVFTATGNYTCIEFDVNLAQRDIKLPRPSVWEVENTDDELNVECLNPQNAEDKQAISRLDKLEKDAADGKRNTIKGNDFFKKYKRLHTK